MEEEIKAAVAKKILATLEGERFARWYEDVFVPQYLSESMLSETKVLEKIRKLFDL